MSQIKKGDRVTFTYHGKPRSGTVEDAKQTSMVVKLDAPEDGTQYKGFKYDKMQHLNIQCV